MFRALSRVKKESAQAWEDWAFEEITLGTKSELG